MNQCPTSLRSAACARACHTTVAASGGGSPFLCVCPEILVQSCSNAFTKWVLKKQHYPSLSLSLSSRLCPLSVKAAGVGGRPCGQPSRPARVHAGWPATGTLGGPGQNVRAGAPPSSPRSKEPTLSPPPCPHDRPPPPPPASPETHQHFSSHCCPCQARMLAMTGTRSHRVSLPPGLCPCGRGPPLHQRWRD